MNTRLPGMYVGTSTSVYRVYKVKVKERGNSRIFHVYRWTSDHGCLWEWLRMARGSEETPTSIRLGHRLSPGDIITCGYKYPIGRAVKRYKSFISSC